MKPLLFEWDEKKDSNNKRKHGFSFQDANQAFFDPLSITLDDVIHSFEEQRFILLGAINHTIVTISFTQRYDRIRIISCRSATRKERNLYEQSKR